MFSIEVVAVLLSCEGVSSSHCDSGILLRFSVHAPVLFSTLERTIGRVILGMFGSIQLVRAHHTRFRDVD